MAEYIEREALIEKILKLEVEGAFTEALKNATLKTISEEPAADVQEVRLGKWRRRKKHIELVSRNTADWTNFRCSNCDSPYYCPTKYCPYCGAKMDKE